MRWSGAEQDELGSVRCQDAAGETGDRLMSTTTSNALERPCSCWWAVYSSPYAPCSGPQAVDSLRAVYVGPYGGLQPPTGGL